MRLPPTFLHLRYRMIVLFDALCVRCAATRLAFRAKADEDDGCSAAAAGVTRGHVSCLQVYRLKLHKEQSARALLLQRSWRGHWCRRCMLENLQRKYAAPPPPIPSITPISSRLPRICYGVVHFSKFLRNVEASLICHFQVRGAYFAAPVAWAHGQTIRCPHAPAQIQSTRALGYP